MQQNLDPNEISHTLGKEAYLKPINKGVHMTERDEFISTWKAKINYVGLGLASETDNPGLHKIIQDCGLSMRSVLNTIANDKYPKWSVDDMMTREG